MEEFNVQATASHVKKAVVFSIVTATYNAATVLPRLIESLKAQTDQEFEWVVADGASTDETLELLKAASEHLNLRMDSRPDFGIYDALNRGVKMAAGEYYLVMGADDELFSDAVEKYKLACAETDGDLITADIELDGKVRCARNQSSEWLYGAFAHVSSHAVGLVIKRSLHEKYGYYSNKFPLAADQLFILKVIHDEGAAHRSSFVAGKYCLDGMSGSDSFGCLLESYRVQCLNGNNLILQTIILFLRILKNFNKYK